MTTEQTAETFEATGHCLCGGVKVQVPKASKKLGVCHCSMCRQWVGGPLFAVDGGTDASFDDGNSGLVKSFESSEWAQRGFCQGCGTGLFYKLKPTGQYIVPLGLLNHNEDEIIFDHQIFVDQRPCYYNFSNQTYEMTGEEVFKQFGASSGGQ